MNYHGMAIQLKENKMTEQQERIDILEDILIRLHDGASPDSVQEEFNEHFTGVSAIEISMMEHQLMFGESKITFEDVLKLCNVHAKMFENNVDEAIGVDIEKPGHPVQVFKEENMALRQATMRIENILNTLEEMDKEDIEDGLLRGLKHQYDLMSQFKKHYERKEKIFFPAMEKYGHDSPSKVMWGKDDEIRMLFDEAYKQMNRYPKDSTIEDVKDTFSLFKYEFDEMIFKEEAILLNILIESLTVDDWYQAAKESDPYGYAIITPTEKWIPEDLEVEKLLTEESNGLEQTDESVDINQYNTSSDASNTQVNQVSTMNSLASYRVPFTNGDLTLSWNKKSTTLNNAANVNRNVPIQLGDGLLSINQVTQVLEYIPVDITYYSLNNKVVFYNHENSSETRDRRPVHLGSDASVLYPKSIFETISKVFKQIKEGTIKEESYWFPREREYLHYQFKGVYHDGELIGILEIIRDIQPYLERKEPVKRDLTPLETFTDLSVQKVNLSKLETNQEISALETKQIMVDDQIITITIEDSGEIDPLQIDRGERIPMNNGSLSQFEMETILNSLPFEISFVDHHDIFQYYNRVVAYEDMIFKRTPVQVGRDIELCHPPHIWPTASEIFRGFKSQERLFENMWFKKGDELINILYQANYDQDNNYLGALETVEDIQVYIDKAEQPKSFEE